MLTHLIAFLKSINWVDVALAALFIRVIFISVRNGFVTEFFKFLGVICGLFISLHYYAVTAAWAAEKTTLPLISWRFLIFVALWAVVVLVFKFIGDGFMILFKVQANHEGIDKYAAGFLGAGRAIFLASLSIFALLLMPHTYIRHEAGRSWGYKIAAKAAPNTYAFLHRRMIGKVFEREKFNDDVFAVVSGHGINPK